MQLIQFIFSYTEGNFICLQVWENINIDALDTHVQIFGKYQGKLIHYFMTILYFTRNYQTFTRRHALYKFLQPLNSDAYHPVTPSVFQGVINLDCDHVKGV